MLEGKNRLILIIEDEEDILELLEYTLQKEGYETIGFLNANENVKKVLDEEKIDLILMDRNLPNIEGTSFIKDLRSNDLSLYNYVENLSVTDVISGEIIDVKVTVGLDYQSGKYSNEEARTEYNSIMKSGSKHYVNYKSKEPYYDVTPGPINSQDEIGFDITLFSTEDWAD